MKIREVRTWVLRHELPEAEVFGSSKGWHTARQALVVEILTGDGLTGFGEAYGPPAVNRTLIDELYAPRLVGKDALEHAVIWEDLYTTFRDYGRKGWPVAAISAIDIALWDLKGKALGQAIGLGRKVEAYDLAWFEEPVVPEDLDGYCQVKAALRIPISGGETEYTRWGFRELCARRAVDILQPDLCGCGGFTEAWRIAALASASSVTVYPHVWGTAVGLLAGLHLTAALPPNPPAIRAAEPLFELDRTPNPPPDPPALNPPQRAGDMVDVPTGPGLGLEIDRAVLERYRA